MRHEYVQKLLSNVPKDAKNQFEIIEKDTVEPTTKPSLQDGVYDSIEGYRIEVKTGPDGKTPSTMVLRKMNKQEQEEEEARKKKEEEKQEQEDQPLEDPEDPDALFETMMMLKDMNMDKEDQERPTTPIPAEAKPLKPSSKHVRFKEEDTKEVDDDRKDKGESTTAATAASTSSPNSILKKQIGENKDTTNTTTTTITKTANQAQQPQQKKPKKKKKKNVPELSLFGTIWTMLDHMTTKATRSYLAALHNNQDVDIAKLMEDEAGMDDGAYIRGQIFSEKILET
jgi:hypothetical protein